MDQRGDDDRLVAAWTWVSGPSTFSGPHGHLTGLVQDSGNGVSHIAVLLVAPDGTRHIHVLDDSYPIDDHNAPGLTYLGGGEFLAAFAGHGDEAALGVARLRVTGGRIDELARSRVVLPAPATYAHVLDVGDPEGRRLVLTRSIGWNPTGVWLDPETLVASAPFLAVPWAKDPEDPNRLRGSGGRPYLVSRQLVGSALVALVHDHPRAYRNGVVVAELAGGRWLRMDGTDVRALDDVAEWDPFAELDVVVPPGGDWVPWVHDVQRDASGRTAVAWSERHRPRDDSPRVAGLRYGVADYQDAQWRRVAVLHAGRGLYPREGDYAGGIAFETDSVDRLVLVSDVDPLTGEPRTPRHQRRYELHGDGERPWLRELARAGKPLRPREAVLTASGSAHASWILSGEYRNFNDFGTRPDVFVHQPGVSCFREGDRHIDLPFDLRVEGGMPTVPRGALTGYLADAESYLEFGAGSSTLIALALGVSRIVSVDTDPDLLEAIGILARAQGAGARFIGRPVVVDQIGDWGYPIADPDPIATGRRYVARGLEDELPALVLVDGRYRVASFLEVAQNASGPTVVLWDDYSERGHYHLAEELIPPTKFFHRLAVFQLPGPIVVPRRMLDTAYRDPR